MRSLVALGLAACACSSGGSTGSAGDRGPITVFAASSLKELVTGIAADFEARTGRDVRLQLEASSALARQIQEGAPADVFVTAAPEWLGELKTLSREDWLSNDLVVVVPADLDPESFDLHRMPSLAMAAEQVPAGKYARAALAALAIQPPARILYGASARDVLSKVSRGGAAAGIVYATDAAIDPGVKVAYTFPPGSHPTIVYAVGVLTERGRAFAGALRAPASVRAAVKQGFVPLE